MGGVLIASGPASEQGKKQTRRFLGKAAGRCCGLWTERLRQSFHSISITCSAPTRRRFQSTSGRLIRFPLT
jgi:hypothetical protein